MSIALYIIGPPGVGKSTMVRHLLNHLGAAEPVQHAKPIAHTTYNNGWTQLGKERPTFPGTDTLPYNAIRAATEWIASPERPTNLIAEGDRLAVDRFIRCLKANYRHFHLIHLTAEPSISYERMTQRAAEHGLEPQNEAWWRGRATKANNLANRWNTVLLNAHQPPEQLAEEAANIIERARNAMLATCPPKEPRQR